MDEVGELPLNTQVRLLRVLETGEYIKVGSSQTQKTNVRVVAATNVNLMKAIEDGKFREDLYYRLNTVPISIPPLRDRKEDIDVLFRKFANDNTEKYGVPPIRLDENAKQLLATYRWPGNIRQLKNIAEQVSILAEERMITYDILKSYIPNTYETRLPTIINKEEGQNNYANEREILFKLLFDMKNDMNELKKLVHDIIGNESQSVHITNEQAQFLNNVLEKDEIISTQISDYEQPNSTVVQPFITNRNNEIIEDTAEIIEESLSLEDKEIEFIKKALSKHNGKRKLAAEELGISERTLYRKIKEYDI